MTAPRGLHALARLHGLQTAYRDNDGRRVGASPEALMETLRALRVPVRSASDIPRLLDLRRRELWERGIPPVVAVWTRPDTGLTGEDARLTLRSPARHRDRPVHVSVTLERGDVRELRLDGGALDVVATTSIAGADYVERRVPLPPVPAGYHRVAVEVGEDRGRSRREAHLIGAPRRAAGWEVLGDRPGWGLFAPLHALWEHDAGEAPTYGHLARLAGRVADAGGQVVGTLPLLAGFFDRPFDPSPYAPVSRLFWNELYVDSGGAHVKGVGAGAGPAVELDARAVMASRRGALEAEARRFFEAGAGEGDGDAGEPAEMTAYRERRPRLDDYARFRALVEERGPWPEWPDRLRARDIRPGDYDPARARYHRHAQWRSERELAAAAGEAERRGVSFYLDLPLGVHPWGYDVWRERELFATGATAGAPPDGLAPGGQDWGFPPLHPEASRARGHRYFIEAVRTHLRYSRVLRIDHVMQLHRMFWVPDGDSSAGVYVRYPAEELYAILVLESRRAGAVVVGEDLGTVPRAVRRGMRRHGLPGMYVLEFELTEDEQRATNKDEQEPANNNEQQPTADSERPPPALVPRGVPGGALASIGTHDTPTFAGWWWGTDIEIRRAAGRVSDEEAAEQLRGRGIMRDKLIRGLGEEVELGFESDVEVDLDLGPDGGAADGREALAVLEALLRRLGESDAGLVLATMEDLWLEPWPQNVPGTASEENWRRRSRRPLGALATGPAARLLRTLNRARERTG